MYKATESTLTEANFVGWNTPKENPINECWTYTVMTIQSKYPNLTPQLSRSEIRILRKRLESHKNLLARIAAYCNRKVIDIDFREEWPDKNAQQDIAITIKEAESLLGDKRC